MRLRSVIASAAAVLLLATATASPALAGRGRTPQIHATRAARSAVAWISPRSGQVVRKLDRANCRIRIRSAVHVRRVVFKLDGRVLGRRSRGPYSCFKASRAVAVPRKGGVHVLTAAVILRHSRITRVIKIKMGNTQQTSGTQPQGTESVPPPASAPPAPAPGASTPSTSSPTPGAVAANSWSSDFSTGDFSQWSWWGQGQANIWGDISVVNPASVGIPALNPSDPHVAKMTVTAAGLADGQVNAKLYKGFGSYDASGVEHPPSNVSGTYSAWYYIPSSYQVPLNTWANIFQFKEKYSAGGGSQSDPSWWIQLSTASWALSMNGAKWIGAKPTSSNQPVAMLNRWNNNWTRQIVFMAVPLNRWFQITAVLTQNIGTAYSIDGQPFDTANASEYPVSPFHSSSQEWTFGVGNYTTAPNTTLYVGGASFGSH